MKTFREFLTEAKTYNTIKFKSRKVYDVAMRRFDDDIDLDEQNPHTLEVRVDSATSNAIENYLHPQFGSDYNVTFNSKEKLAKW